MGQIHRIRQSKIPFLFSATLLCYLIWLTFAMVKYARNELLRALDLRLTALKEEILVVLNRAVGSNLSAREISDLSAFVQRFGTSEFWYVKKHGALHFISFCTIREYK